MVNYKQKDTMKQMKKKKKAEIWRKNWKKTGMTDSKGKKITVHTMADHVADSSWTSTVMESKHMPHRRRRFPMGIYGYGAVAKRSLYTIYGSYDHK